MTSNKEITAVIIAGGRGSRMGDLTNDEQKCMLPVEGAPIMTHLLDNLVETFGSADLVIATGYRADSIVRAFGNRYRSVDIEYVHSSEQLETRRRLLLTADLVHNPFLYLAGDVISEPSLMKRVAEGFEREAGTGIIGVISAATDHKPALSHAIISVEGKHAVEMIYPSIPTWNEGQVREMGIAYYDNRFFHRLRNARADQTYTSHVIAEAIRNGVDFAVETYFDRWYHFVRPEDLATKIVFDKPSY